MTDKKLTNEEWLDTLKIYLEKNLDSKSYVVYSSVMKLWDFAKAQLKLNRWLDERLFEIEQLAPNENKWDTILAEKLERAITLNDNKKDYLEITNSINNDIFVITIQRKFGQTPEQLQKQSDIRRFKASKKIANLLNINKQLQGKLIRQEKDIRTLTLLRMPNLEDELKTREEIQRAIDQINILVKNYNKHVFNRELVKLTTSMRSAYQEAWTRSALVSSENLKLAKEIKLLKQELNRKRVEYSKYSKYRKREQHER